MDRNLGAIILAAGKGKRMGMTDANKVTNLLAGKTLILHIVHFLQSQNIQNIIVVVGHYKESVMDALSGEKIIFAEQKEILGSNHAVMSAFDSIPEDITDVMVVYGDDAVLYAEKNHAMIKKLLDRHMQGDNALTMLTIEQENPFGLGRILRDSTGNITGIVEEKDATEEEKKITEINPGCFVFSVNFLKQYAPNVEKSPVTGEYYLTHLIEIAVKNGKTVDTLRGGKLLWRGVNTKEELIDAEKLYKSISD